MGGVRKLLKDIFAVLLLGLFLWHLCSITLFTHTHIVDGVVICHSHPYTGSPDNPGHSHSHAQIVTIAHLSLLLMLAAVFAIFIAYTGKHAQAVRSIAAECTRSGSRRLHRLRGPPFTV